MALEKNQVQQTSVVTKQSWSRLITTQWKIWKPDPVFGIEKLLLMHSPKKHTILWWIIVSRHPAQSQYAQSCKLVVRKNMLCSDVCNHELTDKICSIKNVGSINCQADMASNKLSINRRIRRINQWRRQTQIFNCVY